MNSTEEETEVLIENHRHLDNAIRQAGSSPVVCHCEVSTMKRQKLAIKDQIHERGRLTARRKR